MVHRRGFRRSARIPFKIGHTVLLVVLCDTYELHDAYTTICRVLVDFWWWVRFWFSLEIVKNVSTSSVFSVYCFHVWSNVFLSVRNVFS